MQIGKMKCKTINHEWVKDCKQSCSMCGIWSLLRGYMAGATESLVIILCRSEIAKCGNRK